MTLLVAVILSALQDSTDIPQEPKPRPRISDVEELDPLARSATARDRSVSSSPSTITVLTAGAVRRSAAKSITDALRLVPGLEVQKLSSTESNVSIRSFNEDSAASQGILGLLDGRSVYNEFYGNVVWETIPVTPESIDRIEVIRGPGSFLHGPNAMHGLVNIVTKRPLQYAEGELFLGASGGTYRSSSAWMTYVRKTDDLGFKMTAAWDDIGQFEERGDNAMDKAFLEGRFEAQLAEAARIDVTAGVRRQKVDVLIPEFFGVPTTSFHNATMETFVKANLVAQGLRAQLTFSDFGTDSIPDAIFVPFHVRLDTVDADLQYAFDTIGGNAIVVGAGWRMAQYETRDQDVSGGQHHTNLGWVFAQDEIMVGPVVVTLGMRWDHHSISGENLSPRVAGVWEFVPDHFLRLTGGVGFRNPSLREIWFDMPANIPGLPVPARITGNTELQAEKLRSIELGWSGSLHENLTAGAAVYYNLADRLIGFVPTSYFPSPPFPPLTPDVIGPENTGKDEAYGVEVEAQAELAGEVRLFGHYAFGIRRTRDGHERNPLAPRHKGAVGVRVMPALDWMVAAWVCAFDDTEFGGRRVKEYALLNGRVSYRFWIGERVGSVYVQGFNVLDRHHLEHREGEEYGPMAAVGVELQW